MMEMYNTFHATARERINLLAKINGRNHGNCCMPATEQERHEGYSRSVLSKAVRSKTLLLLLL